MRNEEGGKRGKEGGENSQLHIYELQSSAEDLQLAGVEGQSYIFVPQVREEQTVRICLYVHVCVPPPMIVGEWSIGSGAMAAP